MIHDNSDIEKLITDNRNLVHYLIHRYYPTLINDEDAFQEGMIGLWKACKTYNADVSKFSTYASKCILNQIRLSFRGSEDAKMNNVTSQVDSVISYDVFLTDAEEGGQLSYFLENPRDYIEDHMTMVVFNELVQSLNEQDQRIVNLRMQGFDQRTIANLTNLSQAQVCRRLSYVKSKLKEKFSL